MYNITKAKKAIKDGIKGYLLKDKETGEYIFDVTQRLPFYLEGCPGVGKTQIVSQIARELKIGFVSFSITHHTRNSLLGLPVIKDVENGKYTEYTMSEIIAKVYEEKGKGYEEGILLLDEFACISDTLMPTMLAFLQTKNIGMYHLPDGWLIVLCGNPPEYNKNARKFDAAVLDRMRRLEVEYSYKELIGYAKDNDFHASVISYLEKNPSDVYYCGQEKGELNLVTCRSWENLSNGIKANEQTGGAVDIDFIKQFLKYEKIAIQFERAYKIIKSGVTDDDIRNILEGSNLDSYREKWGKKDAKYWTGILEILQKEMEKRVSTVKYNQNISVSVYISNIFRLLTGIKWSNSLKEKVFGWINDNGRLLSVVANVKNEEYLDVCKKVYGFA